MKRMLKKSLSLLLSALMLFGVIPFLATSEPAEAVSVGSYCATAAVEWAKTHWQEYSSCLLGTNYWYDGGDCANFVSQCLYMGGMDMTGYWNTNGYRCHWTAPYGDTYAGSFIRCTQLYDFLVNVMGAQSINNPSASQVSVGDVLIYSADGASRKTHSAIVIDIVNGVPIVAAHSAENVKYTGYDGKPEHEWHLGFTHSRIWLLKLNGTLCVNNNRKVFDVYTAGSGDLGLYSDAWGSKLTTFLSGEYAHVYRTKASGGYTWGYTFRYGKWGWVKLSSFTYRSHQESPAVDHVFGAWQLSSPGDCKTNRVEKCVCTRCGYTKTRETPGSHVPTSATCTTPSVCTVCGEFLSDALGHDASGDYIETLPATCTDAGEETLYCVRENNGEVCGAVLEVREIPALGHDYVAKTTSPTCTITGTQELTCARCGNKVVDYINKNNTLSEWTTEELAGLTPVKTKTQYRYSDYETTTSYSTSLSGWNRIGSSWVEESSGTIDYVASFPAGFSTSHSLYTTYHKSPVTASETENRKTTVSTSSVGYLYWHWCRGDGQGASNNWNRLISGSSDSEFNTFHAFFSSSRLGKESNSSGYDYSSINSSVCTSTKWWLAGNTDDLPNTNDNDLPVLRCSYKNYKNLFTYERWTAYSNWQDNPVSASSTRRVETQTVYRYDLKELGHLPAVSNEKNYYETDAEVAYSDTNDYPACYWLGTYCTRPGCGAQLDTTDYAHVFPVFDASDIDASVWSVAEQSNDSVTIYKAYCAVGCGCYVLRTVDNHSYTVTTVAPTCLTDGYDLHTCTLHDDCYYIDNTVPALGHDFSGEQEYVAPTCTTAGYLKTYCVRFDNGATCGAFILKEYEPLGHSMTKFEAATATCLLDGNSEYYYCGVCGKYFSDEGGIKEIEEDSWVIPATGHSGLNANGETVWVVEVENGCGVTGWEYNYCQNPWCDGLGKCKFHEEHDDHGYLLDARDIPEIAPDYYVAYTNEYAEYDEDAGEYVPTSCLNEGFVYVTCRNCEGTDHAHSYLPDVVYAPESVGFLEHIPGEWIVEKEAYCVHEGYRTRSCSRCSTQLEGEDGFEVIAAPFNRHDYSVTTINSECSAGTDAHHYVCSRCGETECEQCSALGTPHHYYDGDPMDHDLGDYIVTCEPTCTEQGYKHRECRNDGCDYATTDEPIPPLDHDYYLAETVSPTCTEEGYDLHICRRDDSHRYEDNFVPALGHEWGEWTDNGSGVHIRVCERDDTHTETQAHRWSAWTDNGEGKHIRTCSVCGAEETAVHVWNDGVVTKEATCKEEGEKLLTCTVCSATKTEPIAINPDNHADYGTKLLNAKDATCAEDGYTGDTVCNGCGAVLEAGEAIHALDHDWGNWTDDGNGNHVRVCKRDASHTETTVHVWNVGEVTKIATCKEEGAKLFPCTVCGATKTEVISIDPVNHADYGTKVINAKDATCTEDGYTGDTVCKGCGAVLAAGEGIDPLNHDWGDWTDNGNGTHIRVCNRDAEHKETQSHEWGAWETVVPASYDDEGLEAHICAVCGAREERVLEKLRSWTVTFVVDDANGSFSYQGKTYTVVGKPVRYTSVNDVINPPAVPPLDGFIGSWAEYTLNEEDLVVPARYTKKSDEAESELIVNKESSAISTEGEVEITLDAFAETRNIKTELGAQPYDIVLVVDQSGSMAYVMNEDRYPNKDIYGNNRNYGESEADTRREKLKSVANTFVDMVAQTGLDHRIAIVGFAMAGSAAGSIPAYKNTAVLTPTKTQFGLQADLPTAYANAFVSVKTGLSTLRSAISGIQSEGATAADLGLEMAKGIFASDTENSGRRRLVIFLTDGEPTTMSTYDADVANRAVNYSYLLKNVYNAKVYSIAIYGKANPQNETTDIDRFLHQVSSNYPNAKYGESSSAAQQKTYYYATTDAEALENIFKGVFRQTVSNTVSFDKVTLYDTISNYFTLTVSQEEALRAELKERYGATKDDIQIVRNEDGTTKISICIAPTAVYENNVQTGYGATVHFRVSANENSVIAGEYATNTADAGVLDGSGTQIASFEVPKIRIPQDRVFITFMLGDEIFELRDVQPGQEIIAPQTEMGNWDIAPGTIVTENGTVFRARLNDNERAVVWHTGSRTITETYRIGQIIYEPSVTSPEGMSFVGWDKAVPQRMPNKNLEFTAQYAPHTHTFVKVGMTGDCERGMTTDYRCVCGEIKKETTNPKNHDYIAIITRELNESVVTMTCADCGACASQHINYTSQYDVQKKDRFGKTQTTTATFELTLYNAQNVAVQPESDKPFIVYVPLTQEQIKAGNTLKVFRVEENGEKVLVQSEVVGNYVVLHLDHFSYYVIANDINDVPTYGQTVCSFNGHSYTDAAVTPAGCETGGYTTHTCPVCGDCYTDSETEALGHSWGAWTVIAEPSCTADGLERRICKNDTSHIEERPIEKTAHPDVNGDGLCDRCGVDIGNDNSSNGSNCVCGKYHTGPFSGFIKFFHTIVYFFKNLFGKS